MLPGTGDSSRLPVSQTTSWLPLDTSHYPDSHYCPFRTSTSCYGAFTERAAAFLGPSEKSRESEILFYLNN